MFRLCITLLSRQQPWITTLIWASFCYTAHTTHVFNCGAIRHSFRPTCAWMHVQYHPSNSERWPIKIDIALTKSLLMLTLFYSLRFFYQLHITNHRVLQWHDPSLFQSYHDLAPPIRTATAWAISMLCRCQQVSCTVHHYPNLFVWPFAKWCSAGY